MQKQTKTSGLPTKSALKIGSNKGRSDQCSCTKNWS